MIALLFAVATDAAPWQAPGPGLGRTFAALALVIGLMLVCVWLLRRGTLGLTAGRGRAALKVETALALGDRRTLVIVSVEGRRLLLGLTSAQVNMVTELAPVPEEFGSALDRTLQGMENRP